MMDTGQCNDCYGAIKIALALADAFKCSVNDLPLSLFVSWYEQRQFAILLTLLYLRRQKHKAWPDNAGVFKSERDQCSC